MNLKLDEKLAALAGKIHTEYQVVVDPAKPIELRVDGLCENPGAMHLGLFARQDQTTLFAEHLFAGHGTCNEVEYLAVKSGLTLVQSLCPAPAVPVAVYSDSQLVTKQVADLWRASGQMKSYCLHLRKLSRIYPFTLAKVPRRENQLADSLAQKYISKNSGRCMELEQGRFNVFKQRRANMKLADTFNALTSREFRDYLQQHSLRADLQALLRAAFDGDKHGAFKLAREIREKAAAMLQAVPKGNEIVAQWVQTTGDLIDRTVDLIVKAIAAGDKVDLQYLFEELSGADVSGPGVFDSLVASFNHPLAAYQTDADLESSSESDAVGEWE